MTNISIILYLDVRFQAFNGMLTIYIVTEVMYRVKSRQAGEDLPGHEKQNTELQRDSGETGAGGLNGEADARQDWVGQKHVEGQLTVKAL